MLRSILVTALFFLFCACLSDTKKKKIAYVKPPVISDSALLDLVQKQTIKYFTDGAEPVSGMGRERFHTDDNYPEHDKNVITSGGSGFAGASKRWTTILPLVTKPGASRPCSKNPWAASPRAAPRR